MAINGKEFHEIIKLQWVIVNVIYSTAQLNLSFACELLKQFHKILGQHASNVCTYHVTCCIACKQQHVCSLSFHASPPPSPAHAQYMNYKCLNCSNHGHCMYLIQSQQQSTGLQCWHLLLVVSVYCSKCQPCHKHKQESQDVAQHKPYLIVLYNAYALLLMDSMII